MPRRVVITGIGVVSPIGIGKEDFWRNLAEGCSGITPITAFDLPGSTVKVGGEIKDFHPELFLGTKGLRYLQRGTKILSSAMKLCLQDAALEDDETMSHNTGLIIGSAFGNFIQTTEYTQKIMTSNPAELLPMEGFDAALNSAINYATVHFKLKTCARTYSSGFASGLDALADAARLIRFAQAHRVMAGGFEQLSPDNYRIYSMREQLGFPVNGHEVMSMPFDKRRNGFVLGEGCWLFVLEDYESATQRNAKIYAEVAGSASLFLGHRRFAKEVKIQKVERTMALALVDSGLSAKDVHLISASADSSPEADLVEGNAIENIFADQVPVTAPKSIVGESLGASGAMQLASALFSLEREIIPPTINYKEDDPAVGLHSIVTAPIERRVGAVLINALDFSANCSSLVVKRIN